MGRGFLVLKSGLEDVNHTDDILPTDGTLAHPLPTLGAGDHVSTFQQDTVNGRVHADPTDVVLQAWSSVLTF